jgi:hypothetical protein
MFALQLLPMATNALREWRLACSRCELDLVFPGDRNQPIALSTIVRYVWHPTHIATSVVAADGR